MSEEERVEHSDDTPMIRRRFLTPKVRRGQLATGDQVLEYVEKVNLFALLIVCAIGLVGAAIFGGSAQIYGVLCAGVAGLIFSFISLFTLRYRSITRRESALVQGGGYVVKFAVLIAIFFILSRFARDFIDVRVAAGVVIVFLVARLALSSLIIVRTPVAMDIAPSDE
ncbi:MAG: hypothetical protein IKS49_02830 [Actinomycetaceae bacterium]|nr:hypothetical protein [Actinomycetaceae bacterium]